MNLTRLLRLVLIPLFIALAASGSNFATAAQAYGDDGRGCRNVTKVGRELLEVARGTVYRPVLSRPETVGKWRGSQVDDRPRQHTTD
ncbi:hypothetical protein [Gordonia effusa]|uniref:hypothetical protein n=1 Tax=Gordonia effusa TaxID=263908 RepID=UPI0003163FC2|nr:hypothetical protein [Gordonia effusa]